MRSWESKIIWGQPAYREAKESVGEREKDMEYQLATKEGVLTIKEYKKGLEIAAYKGEDIYLEIPERCVLKRKSAPPSSREQTDGRAEADGSGEETGSAKPVISIGKKAMLSCKSLRRVNLPETIEEVGDWAFAYCDELRELCLPEKAIHFGRGIFRECGKIRSVTVEGKQKDVSGLLAASMTLLDAPYLFTPLRCGDEDWLKQWDARMLQILRAADKDGYSKMVLCGEEDYGSKENNLDYFLNQKRKGKVRIAFMRLLHPLGLQSEVREELEEYLREHTVGCTEADEIPVGREEAGIWDETWQVLFTEHGEDSEYYKLFTEIGCLTEDNFDRILSEAGENFPEMKAWFLKYKEETIGYTDFFADLML